MLNWLFGRRFTLFDLAVFMLVMPAAAHQWGAWGFVGAFFAWVPLGMMGERAARKVQP